MNSAGISSLKISFINSILTDMIQEGHIVQADAKAVFNHERDKLKGSEL